VDVFLISTPKPNIGLSMTVPSELNAIAITILKDNDFCKKLVYKLAIGLHVEDDTLMSHCSYTSDYKSLWKRIRHVLSPLPILDLEVYDHSIVDIDLSWIWFKKTDYM